MTTAKQVREAAFWEETICPACGETGGESRYECFSCGKAVVIPAKEALFILENVEEEEDGDGTA